ncbi:MAG TPA: PilZ domain-containing protein [Stellaceae bacterium]|nr:PilZ domain-containing protein [Stellaceae bacterium]
MAKGYMPPWESRPADEPARAASNNVRHLRRPAGLSGAGDRRLSVSLPGELRVGRTRVLCTILDISNFGASVRIRNVLPDVTRTWLIIATMAPIQSEIAWRKRDRIGLRFVAEQQWVPQLVRDRFDPTAWLRRPED